MRISQKCHHCGRMIAVVMGRFAFHYPTQGNWRGEACKGTSKTSAETKEETDA